MFKRALLPIVALVALFAGSGCHASAGYSTGGYYRTYPSGYYYRSYPSHYPSYYGGAHGYYGPRYYGPRYYGPRAYPEVQRYRPYVHQAPPAYRAPPAFRAPAPARPYVAPRAR